MTLEEAIKRLKEARFTVQPYQYINEALDTVIEALEQEPCEDCISREATLDAIIKRLGIKNETYLLEAERVIYQQILAMPFVNPQKSGWIPVSERLPEDNELVLFSTKTDRVFEGRFFSDNTDRQWYSFCDRTFAWNNVVLAWMPLPEPYKAESEE